jgi:uncharacterized membrane protein
MTSSLPALAPLLAEQELWSNSVNGLIASLALIVSAIGIAVIVWGAYSSVVRLIASEAAAARGPLPTTGAPPARPLFASYLLPGLDFLIAGGAIKTLAVPDWQQATVLGSLVLARTLLGLSWKGEAVSGAAPRDGTKAGARPALPGKAPAGVNGTTEDSASDGPTAARDRESDGAAGMQGTTEEGSASVGAHAGR